MILSDDHIQKVCKIGQGEATCSFLAFDPREGGMSCMKETSLEASIWLKRANGTMKAKGDNCSGPPNFEV